MNKYQKALNVFKTYGGFCKSEYNYQHYSTAVHALQELVDKATPKKIAICYVEFFGNYLISCPTCSFGLFSNEVVENRMYKARCCANCGQALDWSEEND